MIILLNLAGQSLAITAPLGAAAYAVHQTSGKASVIFAMLRKGEAGIDTLNRVLDENTTLKWLPVAARPEEQLASAFGPDDYVAFDFLLDDDGNWTPATDALTNFLEAMQAMASLPTAPPSSLATTLQGFTPQRTGKSKA